MKKIQGFTGTMFLFATSFLLLLACSRKPTPVSNVPAVEEGVSEELAKHRKQVLSQIAYRISLDIPALKEEPINAQETISFYWKKNPAPLQIDFREERDHIKRVVVNQKEVPIRFEKEHILIQPEYLQDGPNTVDIAFIAGNQSLNRNPEYLYTLLVPDRARTVFPVFDQPSLKATYELSLTVPHDWQAVANAPLRDTVRSEQRKTYHFQSSDLISTYLFSFVAGKFERVTRTLGGREMNFYHRETDTSKIHYSLDSIFTIHSRALDFLEDYTQIPYPFRKFDFVAIPDFQYGGMEHVGAIQYKASALFLDKGATRDQKISRANLIAHETAHMWFGDLVTMQWFNDVWMKEVFANFMADKIGEVTLEDNNYDLQFLVNHFPAAYGVDRTAGANPIGQPLRNLKEAGTLYGGIIYHKAPIMMRQLERLMGEEALRSGLREYLKEYSYANATWPDLIRILDQRTPADLAKWNHVWVNETGRPQIDYKLEAKNGTITRFTVSQRAEDGSDRLWPQLFEVALVYPDRVEELTVDMNQRQVVLREAEGKGAPLYVLFNSTGQGYGLFPVDALMLSRLSELREPVMRASAYINFYENMLSHQAVTPTRLAELYRNLLSKEPEEQNLRLLTGQLSEIFWQYIRPEHRAGLANALEQEAWQAMQQERSANKKKVLFKLYQNIALSQSTEQRLYEIWKTQQAPTGVTLTEDDYTSLALALAVRDYPAAGILEQQLGRIKNPDRQKRLQFIMPALSSKAAERDAFFASLSKEENREREANVVTALEYLHHPLRAATSVKYLPQSLELLAEIQRTGDIFFPERWLRATLGTYQSPEAAKAVRAFLEKNPTYSTRLKAKLQQAADGLIRAEKLVYGEE
ncbi:M1 family metallopeptidase [Telluribacter humicola]|uniref:M1 family metallopeptidase n=1 Tax=Telluribacter humicola TaxID=1720261 RepID=UPI001E570187|nr:M1 family aminopeptidase [Telluribacter humicola]